MLDIFKSLSEGCCSKNLDSFRRLVKSWIAEYLQEYFEESIKDYNNLKVGISTYAADEATASVDVRDNNLVFNFGLPKGDKGDVGRAFSYDDFTQTQLNALKGPKGEKGDALSFDDLTSSQLNAIKGPKGDRGEKGDIGPKGEKGDSLDFNSLTQSQLNSIRGPKGDKGDRGESFKFENFTPEQLSRITGPKGDKGDRGEKGERGERGERGLPGQIGENGLTMIYRYNYDVSDYRPDLDEFCTGTRWSTAYGYDDSWSGKDIYRITAYFRGNRFATLDEGAPWYGWSKPMIDVSARRIVSEDFTRSYVFGTNEDISTKPNVESYLGLILDESMSVDDVERYLLGDSPNGTWVKSNKVGELVNYVWLWDLTIWYDGTFNFYKSHWFRRLTPKDATNMIDYDKIINSATENVKDAAGKPVMIYRTEVGTVDDIDYRTSKKFPPRGWSLNPDLNDDLTTWYAMGVQVDGEMVLLDNTHYWSAPSYYAGNQNIATGPKGPQGFQGIDGLPGVDMWAVYVLTTTSDSIDPNKGTNDANRVKSIIIDTIEKQRYVNEEYSLSYGGALNFGKETYPDGKLGLDYFVQVFNITRTPIRNFEREEDGSISYEELEYDYKLTISGVVNGSVGTQGTTGLILYPEGVWTPREYEQTATSTPYVIFEGAFYLLNAPHATAEDIPSTSSKWTMMESMEALYSKYALFGAGAFGSMCFYGRWMFSQQGSGGTFGDFVVNTDEFPTKGFIPNFAVNCATGDVYMNGGRTKFSKAGSGYLASGKISWDRDGSGSIADGKIKWTSDGKLSFGTGVSFSWGQIEGSEDIDAKLDSNEQAINSVTSNLDATINSKVNTAKTELEKNIETVQATIQNNVNSGISSIDTKYTDLLGNKLTYIGDKGLYSGTIAADNIVAGDITTAGIQNGNAWALNRDGDGWIANKNIKWDRNGNVTLTNVSLSWNNITNTNSLTNSIADAKKAGTDAQSTANTANTNAGNAKSAADAAKTAADEAKASIDTTNTNVTNAVSRIEKAENAIKTAQNIIDTLPESNGIDYLKTIINGNGIITGTIANSKLNSDGTNIDSTWLLYQDGSGFLANGNISWDTVGNTTFTGTLQNSIISPVWQLNKDGSGFLGNNGLSWDAKGNLSAESITFGLIRHKFIDFFDVERVDNHKCYNIIDFEKIRSLFDGYVCELYVRLETSDNEVGYHTEFSSYIKFKNITTYVTLFENGTKIEKLDDGTYSLDYGLSVNQRNLYKLTYKFSGYDMIKLDNV